MRILAYTILVAALLILANHSHATVYEHTLPQEIRAYSTPINALKDDLDNAASSDVVIVNVAGYGGDVMEGIQIMNSLNNTEARVIIKVTGPSYSMHAILACGGDQLVMSPYAFLMFHDYSASFSGKSAETRKHMDAIDHVTNRMLQDNCVAKNILLPNEVLLIKEGVDIYITTNDMQLRQTQ